MTNFEYYKNYFLEILEKKKGSFNIGLVKGKPKQCDDIFCSQCDFYDKSGFCSEKLANWFKEEYKDQDVDWTKVPVDTKIFVRNYIMEQWLPRHFAKYDTETNKVFTWLSGSTSWTETRVSCWEFAKLVEEEEEK